MCEQETVEVTEDEVRYLKQGRPFCYHAPSFSLLTLRFPVDPRCEWSKSKSTARESPVDPRYE